MCTMLGVELQMASELQEAPDAVRRQAVALTGPLAALIGWSQRTKPALVVTCARGSSAHAATFAKHLFERHLGIPVATAAPNVATIYRQRLQLKNQLLLTISQSGRSDDLTEFALMAKAAGALTAVIVNDIDSPLAAACDIVLPTAAGPEVSVAATKSFVASLAMLLRIIAEWKGDDAMRAAISDLPERLALATALKWDEAVDTFSHAASLVTIGRGPTLAIAREAALKLKETSNLHAEAFSSAEFQHGPMALVSQHYPLLLFMPTDAAAAGLHELAASLWRKGAQVFAAEHGQPAVGRLPVLSPQHPDADAVCLIQTFYTLAVRIAARRGTNADQPRHLQKVTRTR
jgi:glutamine---fructose-6-phosphate transaminase (isomerizing)